MQRKRRLSAAGDMTPRQKSFVEERDTTAERFLAVRRQNTITRLAIETASGVGAPGAATTEAAESAVATSAPLPEARQAAGWRKQPTSLEDRAEMRAQYMRSELEKEAQSQGAWPSEIINPNSRAKINWDMLIGSLIIYSVCAVPYRIAFDQPTAWPSGAYVFDWCVDVLFLLDMVASFKTAYADASSSVMVTDPKKVRRHYLHSWFALDFCSTVPIDQIVALAMGAGSGAKTRSLKLIRVLRLFRLVKLLRLVKLKRAGGDGGQKDSGISINPAVSKLLRLFFVMIFVAHLFACGWHFLAYDPANFPSGWLLRHMCFGDAMNCALNPRRAYLLSLHWTVATMTAVGYGDVYATDDAERAYSIITQLTGAAMFGFIIGDISSVMNSMDMRTAMRRDKMAEVKAYLRDRKLPLVLQQRVKAYYRYYLARTSIFNEEGILGEISTNLRVTVVMESHQATIKKISLLASADPVSSQRCS
jgi:hypothetical protein